MKRPRLIRAWKIDKVHRVFNIFSQIYSVWPDNILQSWSPILQMVFLLIVGWFFVRACIILFILNESSYSHFKKMWLLHDSIVQKIERVEKEVSLISYVGGKEI